MTQLVGILNITPDSFSDGGLFIRPDVALRQARNMLADGAAIVDIGAESTRPNATPLSDEAEWARLEPVLSPLLQEFPGRISLDSYHPPTIQKAFNIGPVIVNDVTGLNNPDMLTLVVELSATVIISHLPTQDIQSAHRDVPVTSVQQVKDALLAKVAELLAKGLPKDHIILDPGIGFGKTPQVNQQLLKFASEVPDYPVMIGYSRKRFLGENRMEIAPNLAAGRVAASSGAAYIRVHDVAAHRPLLG